MEDFADFVRTSSASLFATALVLTGDPGHAEELLQAVLARVYPKWVHVQAAESPLAYVRRSVVNQFLSERRRNQRIVDVHLPDRPTDQNDVAAVLDRAVLAEMLAPLTPRQRAALVLRYLDDLADPEIASALGCSRATVRTLISRGLRTIRAHETVRTAQESTS